MLEWKTKQTNNIPTNPLECYWAIGKVSVCPRLFVILEQYPADVKGLQTDNKPELYILFENVNGREISNVMTNEKELIEWKDSEQWGDYWFKNRYGSFVHAYKTLDEAKARAEFQIKAIQDVIDAYFH